MKLIPIITRYYCILLLLASLTAADADHNYLLSCGAPSAVGTTPSTFDDRTWQPDKNTTFSTKFESTISASTTSNAPRIPFSTARVFNSSFTYSFPVSPGPKFIRLFFNPSTSPYSSDSLSLPATTDAYLTVQSSSGHLLLHNFSAYLAPTTPPGQPFVRKEFYLHVTDSRLLITFSPTPPSSYAFVNGIEVVSVPERLYVGSPSPKNLATPGNQYDLPPNTALETAYRVNVGGNEVSPTDDAGGMYRLWVSDGPYLSGNFNGSTGDFGNVTAIEYKGTASYSAPVSVYETFRWMGKVEMDIKRRVNVSWGFQVDLRYSYLVRLHWCEVVVDVKSSNYRVFDVYIDQQTADKEVDIILRAGGGYKPYYKDYYVVFLDGGNEGESRGDLQLAMHPNTDSKYVLYDILLNGLEIFKINGADGSLNGTNPSGPPVTTPSDDDPPPNSASHNIVRVILGVVAGAILLISILFFCIFISRRRKLWKTSGSSSGTTSSKSKWRVFSAGKSGTTKTSRGGSSNSLPTHLCRHFTLLEIRLATSDFSPSLIVGHGGFGNVYKGTADTDAGPTPVAIKRLNPLSSQGAREFKMEVELLSKLHHVNLVSLIGYCDDAGEMILVYEYMSRGTLRDHLYPPPNNTDLDDSARLSWRGRLEICTEAARGLHYLHTGTDRMVIHRDVKSTNILLDDRWAAKVSDFGMSRLGPAGGELVSHVSTAVKGSFGYLDPEYCRRQQLTEKSDVYSFGVVLFEVLCGRAAVNPSLPKEQVNLRIWARRSQMSGTLETIVDPAIKGQIAPECLRKFGEVAESCVRDEGAHRPSMADVIGGLELALQLQLESSANTTTTTGHVTGRDIVDDENTPDDAFLPINLNSPTTDETFRLIRRSTSGESTWTSANNSTSSRLFSSTTGKSPAVFSQIFNPEGR